MDYLSGCHVITRVLIKGEDQWIRVREGDETTEARGLNVSDGGKTLRPRKAGNSTSWKREGKKFSSEAPRRKIALLIP